MTSESEKVDYNIIDFKVRRNSRRIDNLRTQINDLLEAMAQQSSLLTELVLALRKDRQDKLERFETYKKEITRGNTITPPNLQHIVEYLHTLWSEGEIQEEIFHYLHGGQRVTPPPS